MSKAEDDALAESLKYGSGPIVGPRQGSVQFGEKYGIAAYVPEATEVPTSTTPKSVDAGDQKKES